MENNHQLGVEMNDQRITEEIPQDWSRVLQITSKIKDAMQDPEPGRFRNTQGMR